MVTNPEIKDNVKLCTVCKTIKHNSLMFGRAGSGGYVCIKCVPLVTE